MLTAASTETATATWSVNNGGYGVTATYRPTLAPVAGDMYLDSETGDVYRHNGSTWVLVMDIAGTVNAAVARMNAAGDWFEFDGWARMPVSASWTIEPAGAFVVDTSDDSIRPVVAGWYSFSASTYSDDASLTQVFLSISTSSTPGSGTIANTSASTTYPALNATGTVYLAANQKVWVYANASTTWMRLFNYSVAREGGPPGPAGTPEGAFAFFNG